MVAEVEVEAIIQVAMEATVEPTVEVAAEDATELAAEINHGLQSPAASMEAREGFKTSGMSTL